MLTVSSVETCTIPKEVTKNGREHTFPVSDTAAKIHRDDPREFEVPLSGAAFRQAF
jgi:hypothetical protein